MALEKKGTVCVIGAGGYLASSRDTWATRAENQKYAHLWKLDKAPESLKLFKADLLDCDSLLSAINGCTGVFRVASPAPPSAVTNPEVELLETAVKGTRNVPKQELRKLSMSRLLLLLC